jgi:hydroxyethylthiazole kinase
VPSSVNFVGVVVGFLDVSFIRLRNLLPAASLSFEVNQYNHDITKGDTFMKIAAADIYRSVEDIRAKSPLIHNITNYVVMNNTANALLAIGASPVMIHAEEEVEDMAAMASALVINIGTMSAPWVRGMFKAFAKAVSKGVPVVIDPVGAGATPYRTRTIRELIDAGRPTIIRGNASEIMALADDRLKTKGVDSTAASDQALHTALSLSEKHQCAVCISGAVDYVVEGKRMVKVENGHPMMTKVTGLGCTASALCGAFAAVDQDSLTSAAKAMAVMGIAGEMAAEVSEGPGSLQMHFLDRLYGLTEADIAKRLKIKE